MSMRKTINSDNQSLGSNTSYQHKKLKKLLSAGKASSGNLSVNNSDAENTSVEPKSRSLRSDQKKRITLSAKIEEKKVEENDKGLVGYTSVKMLQTKSQAQSQA